MGSLQKLEAKLDDFYNKRSPVQLPKNAKKTLAGAWWWIALVLGVLQLWAAWALWQAAHYLDPIDRTVDAVNEYFGYTVIDNDLNMFYYLAIVVVVIDAFILLLAAPQLKAFKKSGWTLLYYSLLVNVVYGFVRLFSDVGGGPMPLLWTLVMTLVTGFFIFQVRDHFKGSEPHGEHSPAKAAKSHKEEE